MDPATISALSGAPSFLISAWTVAQQIPDLGGESNITKLGVIGALLLLIVWMIKYFVSAIERTQAAQAGSVREVSVAVTAMGEKLASSDDRLATAIQDLRVAAVHQAASNFALREVVVLQSPQGSALSADQVDQVAARVVARLKE